MQIIDFYSTSHLFVAAIRVLQHQKNTPPSIEAVSETLSFSLEQGSFIARELQGRGIIDVVEGSFGTRLFIKDHLALEEIPKDARGSRLEDELKRFQDTKIDHDNKVATIHSKQAKKQKDLFAELEKKLKKTIEKK